VDLELDAWLARAKRIINSGSFEAHDPWGRTLLLPSSRRFAPQREAGPSGWEPLFEKGTYPRSPGVEGRVREWSEVEPAARHFWRRRRRQKNSSENSSRPVFAVLPPQALPRLPQARGRLLAHQRPALAFWK
jgi:hypothetical protein